MGIYENLQSEFKQNRADGLTNERIGEKYGISHSHANRLLNGDPAQFGSLKFSTILRMFPRVRRLLEGDAQTISISNSPSSAAAINGTANAGGLDAVAEIMRSDMCAECKVKAYNAIMGRWGK